MQSKGGSFSAGAQLVPHIISTAEYRTKPNSSVFMVSPISAIFFRTLALRCCSHNIYSYRERVTCEDDPATALSREVLMRKAFDHIGIITTEPQSQEFWVESSQVWVTNPRSHPARLEFVRPKVFPLVAPDQVGLWKLWHWPHVAYRVENLQAALVGEEVVYGPFRPADFAEIAFIHKDGVIVEYLQYAELDHWFGEPNPAYFQHVPLGE
jgi:hypothetical protein